MNINDLTVGQVKEISNLLGNKSQETNRLYKDGEIAIVVLDRGWIYVGQIYKYGNCYRLENAYNVRTWGTSKGLGELINGPLSNTKIDKIGIVRFNQNAIILAIDVDQEKWREIII